MSSYVLAKLLQLDQIRLLLLSNFRIHVGALEMTYVKLSEDQEVQNASAAYIEARSRLVAALVELARVA